MAKPFKIANKGDFSKCAKCGRKLKDVLWDNPNQVYVKDGNMLRPDEVKRPLRSIAPLHLLGSECVTKIPTEYLWQFGTHWCDGHEPGECAACEG